MINHHSQKGNILLAMLAGVAALSVMTWLGVTAFNTINDGGNRATSSLSSDQMMDEAVRLLAKELTIQDKNVLAAPYAAGTPNPLGGGLIPITSVAPRQDAYGTKFGYCTNVAIYPNDAVFAVVSAGVNKAFDTTCAQALLNQPQGDDVVRVKTKINVTDAVGGTPFWGAPVADIAALNAIPVASLQKNQQRLVVSTNMNYVWDGAAWRALSAQANTSASGCNPGYVQVPTTTLRDGTVVPSFCMMQYEARVNALGVPVADVTAASTSLPVSHTWQQAHTDCAKDNGAQLISDDQWLAAATNISTVASNWSGGAVGSGLVYRGISERTAASMADPAGADPFYCTAGGCPLNPATERRTLTLSNGQVLWDFSGNVMEWTDATISAASPFGFAQGSGWHSPTAFTSPVMPIKMIPPNGWTLTQGMGGLLSTPTGGAWNSVSEAPDFCTGWCAGTAVLARGGYVNYGAESGIFMLSVYYGKSIAGGSISFRCVNPTPKVKMTTTACPSGYVPVPPFNLPDGTAVPAFCVMKYEARNNGFGVPTSERAFALNAPWTSLTWQQAKSACAKDGATLIGEDQWLSIAHQMTTVPRNWNSGQVGIGAMYNGVSLQTVAANSVDPVGDDGYYFAGGTLKASERRTLFLPNGYAIWDMSGNYLDYVDAVIPVASRYYGGTTGWHDYTGSVGIPLNKLPPNGWGSVNGMGRYYESVPTQALALNGRNESPDFCTGWCSDTAIYARGGYFYNYGVLTGVFNLMQYVGRSSTSLGVIRCTK